MNTVTQFPLTKGQQAALEAFNQFLLDPTETVFVLSGYSGCGKSTLVETLLDRLHAFQKTIKLINPSYVEYTPELTATTNKAAENLGYITGRQVRTIQSFLGLRVDFNPQTRTSRLVGRTNFAFPERVLLFIDEASFIDKELLGYIFTRTKNCKVVFIGDPAQLIPVKSTNTPVFNAGFTGAALTEVVRQANGNPIMDLSTKFRKTVETGQFFNFTPDGHHVQRLDRAAFNQVIETEFTRPDWKYADSKILGWTNKCVEAYNKHVRTLVKGAPHFQVGDYAVCNSFVSVGNSSIKTDQLVQLTRIEADVTYEGVDGNWITVDGGFRAFQPKDIAQMKARAKSAQASKDFSLVTEIDNSWFDLRGAYACTVNKAQGSTFDSVFIDLTDIGACNSGDQIARMMYVAVSRAKNFVVMTGDLA